MRKLRLLLFLFAVLSFTSCKKSGESSEDTENVFTTSDENGNQLYPDGTYCADIDKHIGYSDMSKLENNYILISKRGSIGRTALLDTDFPVCINQSIEIGV